MGGKDRNNQLPRTLHTVLGILFGVEFALHTPLPHWLCIAICGIIGYNCERILTPRNLQICAAVVCAALGVIAFFTATIGPATTNIIPSPAVFALASLGIVTLPEISALLLMTLPQKGS